MTTMPVFLGGDVMTGRGVDQALPHPGSPELHEQGTTSARDYLRLAESAHGPIARPLAPRAIWGDLLGELQRRAPACRIVNLETAVTSSDDAWQGKGIHYRMHPDNVDCLTAARLDACVLANNHVLDWGRHGLAETLETLRAAGLDTIGAGRDADEAARPAALSVPGGGRLVLFAFAMSSSGVPQEWAAAHGRSGVNWVADPSPSVVERIGRDVRRDRRQGDVVVVSLHWGPNWIRGVTPGERAFARALIDSAGADVVYGHSSHHPRGIEVHRGKPILYGCGDLINDYEGIEGHERFRPNLAVAYFPVLDTATGRLVELEMVPLERRGFSLRRACVDDARWLAATLTREGEALGTQARVSARGDLVLRWR